MKSDPSRRRCVFTLKIGMVYTTLFCVRGDNIICRGADLDTYRQMRGHMLRFFKRREDVFSNLIVDQAAIMYDGLKLLAKYLESPQPDIAEELSLKEKEADEVRRILIDELNRAFVTPFDREDIFSLSRSIDDMVDYADTTAVEMSLLKVQPTVYMVRIASLLIRRSCVCKKIPG